MVLRLALPARIIAFTDNEMTYRRLAPYWGVRPRLLPPAATADELIRNVEVALREVVIGRFVLEENDLPIRLAAELKADRDVDEPAETRELAASFVWPVPPTATRHVRTPLIQCSWHAFRKSLRRAFDMATGASMCCSEEKGWPVNHKRVYRIYRELEL